MSIKIPVKRKTFEIKFNNEIIKLNYEMLKRYLKDISIYSPCFWCNYYCPQCLDGPLAVM